MSEERVVRERLPAGPREAHVEREAVVTRETVAGPEAADDDVSAPAVVDGEEVDQRRSGAQGQRSAVSSAVSSTCRPSLRVLPRPTTGGRCSGQ
ncbi:hypothetical protein QJS66_19865 [Kocuria rhizophila]|nr:hypothetical protein QJS66_19865 [Kocuria rhizophila]